MSYIQLPIKYITTGLRGIGLIFIDSVTKHSFGEYFPKRFNSTSYTFLQCDLS